MRFPRYVKRLVNGAAHAVESTVCQLTLFGALFVCAAWVAAAGMGPQAADEVLRQNSQIKSLPGVPGGLRGDNIQGCPAGGPVDVSRSRCVVAYLPGTNDVYVFGLYANTSRVWFVLKTDRAYRTSVYLGAFDLAGRITQVGPPSSNAAPTSPEDAAVTRQKKQHAESAAAVVTQKPGEIAPETRIAKDDAALHVGQALPTPDNLRHILKLGESASGITFARKGNDAIAFFGNVLVTKCVTASTFQGERRIYLDGAIGKTRLYVSPTSSKGQFVAVACTQEDDPAYDMHLINLITRSISSPKPSPLFAALHPWISFSPNERYAVLNQHGDEGNYAPLALDLRTGQGKILAAPIIPEDKDRLWVDDKTIRYRVGSICDGPIVDDGCKSSLGEYEFSVDVSTLKVKQRRVGNSK
jgi:hypothetical protein